MIEGCGIDGFVRTHGGQENGLIEIIKANIDHAKPFSLIEIGVWSGFTALSLLEAFPTMQYTGVDPYVTYSWCDRAELIEQARSTAAQRLAGHARARLLITTSEAVALQYPDKSFEIAFVDGNHEYGVVKRDLYLWRPKVKIILAGHDYVGVAPVKQAVDEMAAVWKEAPKFATGDVWYFALNRQG